MSEVNFKDNWEDASTQCRQCRSFKIENDKSACVPEGESFEEALAAYGECSPTGHCDFFEVK